MRYAVLSDIHSNLEALESVLSDSQRERVGAYVCLGDIVGYGADPDKCVGEMLGRGDMAVAGNHDACAAGLFAVENFTPSAAKAILWTSGHITDKTRQRLRELPLVCKSGDGAFTASHGTLNDPGEFNYVYGIPDVQPSFELLENRVLFIGHTPVPGIFEQLGGAIRYLPAKNMVLKNGAKYIINAGSVGQPRDGDPRACYIIYDTDENTVYFKRAEYDIVKAQEKILFAGLPAKLAYRLTTGS